MKAYTDHEFGAVLKAIGSIMMLNNIAAPVARSGPYDVELISLLMREGIDRVRAKDLIEVELPLLIF